MLGILSNPVVTIMWFLEQFDVHVMGSTPRASDWRILISIILNGIVVLTMHLVRKQNPINAIFYAVAIAWFSSHNFMSTMAFLKPFSVQNEKVQMQKEY